MSLRLMWELVEIPRFMLAVGFLMLSAFAFSMEGYLAWLYYGICLLFTAQTPNVDGFKAMGLSSKDWNMQRRVEASIVCAIVFGVLVVKQPVPWLFIVAYPIIAALVIIPPRTMPVRWAQRKGELLAESEGRRDDGWFPPSIEGQLIVRPQVKAWGYIFVIMMATTGLIAGVGTIFGLNWVGTLQTLAVVISVAFFMVNEDTIAQSLREYVTFGGTRTTWAHYTIAINAVVPAILIACGLAIPNWTIISSMGAAYLMALLLILALSTLTRNIWSIAVLVGSLAVFLYVIFGMAQENYLLPVIIAAAGYIIGGLLLPTMARKSNLQTNGLARWLGVKASS